LYRQYFARAGLALGFGIPAVEMHIYLRILKGVCQFRDIIAVYQETNPVQSASDMPLMMLRTEKKYR